MSRHRSGIKKRPAGTPNPKKGKALHIPLKEKTAKNILALNDVVGQKLRELEEAQANLQNHVLPICTERGLPDGTQVVQVTEKPPWELIVMVPRSK